MSTAAEFRRNPQQLPLGQQCAPLITSPTSILKSDTNRIQSLHSDSSVIGRNYVSNNGLFHAWDSPNVHNTSTSFSSCNLNSPTFIPNSTFPSYALPMHSTLPMHPTAAPNLGLSNQCDPQSSTYYQMSQYRRPPQLPQQISPHESVLQYNGASSTPYHNHLQRSLNHNSSIASPYHSPNSVTCSNIQNGSNMPFSQPTNSTNVSASNQFDTSKPVYSAYHGSNQNGFGSSPTSPLVPCNNPANIYRPLASQLQAPHAPVFGSLSHHPASRNNFSYSNAIEVNENKESPSSEKGKTLSSYLLQQHLNNSSIKGEMSPNSAIGSVVQLKSTIDECSKSVFMANSFQQNDTSTERNRKRSKGRTKKSANGAGTNNTTPIKASPLYSVSQYTVAANTFASTDGSNSSSDFLSAGCVSAPDGDAWLDEIIENPSEKAIRKTSGRLGPGRREMKNDLNATPESIMRREDRRKRNRESAQRCRARKNSALEELVRKLKASLCELGTHFMELEKAFQVSQTLHDAASQSPGLVKLLSQYNVASASLASSDFTAGMDSNDSISLMLLHEEHCRKVSQYFQEFLTTSAHQSVRDALTMNMGRSEKFFHFTNHTSSGVMDVSRKTSPEVLDARGSDMANLLKTEPSTTFSYNNNSKNTSPTSNAFFSESLTSLLH